MTMNCLHIRLADKLLTFKPSCFGAGSRVMNNVDSQLGSKLEQSLFENNAADRLFSLIYQRTMAYDGRMRVDGLDLAYSRSAS